jgi:hypothetical protein
MRKTTSYLIFVTWLALALAGGWATAASETAQKPHKCPRIFDGTLYRNKPAVGKFGMEPTLVLPLHLWYPGGKTTDDMPPRKGADAWLKSARMRKLSDQRVMFIPDLEHWPWRGEKAVVDRSVGRFLELLGWMREDYRGPIGFYGVPPLRDYWRAQRGPESKEYREWQAENDAWKPLADRVDALFPSLYTFYDDLPGWERYAIANIREAKRVGGGKPVYAFLSAYYHNSNALSGQKVSAEMWRRQLEIASEHGDGAVLYFGWNDKPPGPAWWKDDAEWWQITKDFLAKRPRECQR